MTVTKVEVGVREDKTERTKGTFKIEIPDGNNSTTYQYIFVNGVTIKPDAGLLGRDFIGSGESTFTQGGDVVGTFSFNVKDTIDLHDAASPAVDAWTFSYWAQQIAKADPPIVQFIKSLNAPNATGTNPKKYAILRFKGRIMSPTLSEIISEPLEDIVIDGEITAWDLDQRVTAIPT